MDNFGKTFGNLRSGDHVTVGTGKQVDRYGNEYFRGVKKIYKDTGFADHTFGAGGSHYDIGKDRKK